MPDNPMIAALIKAQGEFKPITEDNTADTGKFKYKYADLGTVLDAVLPALHANGFALTQGVDTSAYDKPPVVTVDTTLHHVSGESINSSYPVLVADMNDPQKVGGAVSYGRRYSLMALLALATDDDDAAHARTPSTRAPEPRRATETPAPESRHSMIDNDQMKAIFAGAADLGMAPTDAKLDIYERYNVNSTKELTFAQAKDYISVLNAKKAKRQQEAEENEL